MTPVQIGSLAVGGGHPLLFIVGPCVIESAQHALEIASAIRDIARRASVPVIFKASYDKANRTSRNSFRGPGLDAGLKILADIRLRTGLPVLTDVHDASHAERAAAVVDVLQIPAFLSRQTDLLVAAARTGKAVNLKKGQFLAPTAMRHAVEKITAEGNYSVLLTERGTSFGYHDLVVDMRALPIMRELGFPVVLDATHSLQLPPGADSVTAGAPQFIEPLASAGVAAGADAVFLEVHEEPSRAKSDASTALSLDRLEPLMRKLKRIDAAARDSSTDAASSRAESRTESVVPSAAAPGGRT